MRAVVRCVLAVIGIAASVIAGPAGPSMGGEPVVWVRYRVGSPNAGRGGGCGAPRGGDVQRARRQPARGRARH